MGRAAIVLLVACAAGGGCVSPENGRTRGGNAGADTGNRPRAVKMHEGSQPYWKTPELITGEHPPLEPALHAQQSSRGR